MHVPKTFIGAYKEVPSFLEPTQCSTFPFEWIKRLDAINYISNVEGNSVMIRL